jgi:hypothetical protein
MRPEAQALGYPEVCHNSVGLCRLGGALLVVGWWSASPHLKGEMGGSRQGPGRVGLKWLRGRAVLEGVAGPSTAARDEACEPSLRMTESGRDKASGFFAASVC